MFKAVWKLAQSWISKESRKRIIIESKKGRTTFGKFNSKKENKLESLGGTSNICILENPGNCSKELNESIAKGIIVNPDTSNLRKYFWDVDMSKPGNEFGVKTEEPKKEK